MKKKRVFFLILMQMMICGITIASYEGLFDQANKAYTEGDFVKAADDYKELIKNEGESASLYYNLGNAHFRLNQLGHAYWALQKAHQLEKHDEDIFQNLTHVKTQLQTVQVEDSRTLFIKALDLISQKIGATGWLILAVLSSAMFSLTVVMCFKNRNFKRNNRIKCVGLLILMVSCLSLEHLAKNEVLGIHQGVVLSDDSDIRYQPSYNGATAFKLPEGAMVPILRQHEGWYQIRVSEKRSGWIHENEFKPL